MRDPRRLGETRQIHGTLAVARLVTARGLMGGVKRISRVSKICPGCLAPTIFGLSVCASRHARISADKTDITLSSFFSLHRPISLHKPLPPQTSKESFDRIFQPASARRKNPSDVIYSLSNAIEALDPQSETVADSAELRWEIVDEGSQEGGITHLDGSPRARSLDDIVSHLRPYSTPPPPQPLDSQAAQKKSKSSQPRSRSNDADLESAVNERSFKTTIYLHEMTDNDGTKSYYAHSTPVVQIEPENETSTTEGEVSGAVASETVSDQSEIRDQRQPFLNRMRRRQRRHNTVIRDQVTGLRKHAPAANAADEMLAISVKRQRKLKMKKHKYKKLMRRTRMQRRKLEKN